MTTPIRCPLCGTRLIYEEGSSGFTYAYCPGEGRVIGDVQDDQLDLDPWVQHTLDRAKKSPT